MYRFLYAPNMQKVTKMVTQYSAIKLKQELSVDAILFYAV